MDYIYFGTRSITICSENVTILHTKYRVACQRYVCPNVISMTMNVIIQECVIENCFIEPYV